MTKLKMLLVVSIVINLTLGIFIARNLGQIKGLEEIKTLYLSVACTNLSEFRRTLEGYNTDHLSVQISAEEKQRWVEKQLSDCKAL